MYFICKLTKTGGQSVQENIGAVGWVGIFGMRA
jgi:hypothetical protein